MGRISTKINLASLKNATILKMGKNKDVECLIIPIEQNNLYKSDKGAVYLDLIGFEISNPKEGSKETHIIKQSLSKELQDKMSDEEKKAMPIFGNHIDWSKNSSAPIEQVAPYFSDESDLPF